MGWKQIKWRSLFTSFNCIDQEWRSDYSNELEFGKFTNKSSHIKYSTTDEDTGEAVLKVHSAALCEQIEDTLPKFYDETARAAVYEFRDEYSGFGINAEQHMYSISKPLCGALCLVIDEPVTNATKQNVHLISICCTPGLGEAIGIDTFVDEGSGRKSESRQASE
jgi:hypothetical protein